MDTCGGEVRRVESAGHSHTSHTTFFLHIFDGFSMFLISSHDIPQQRLGQCYELGCSWFAFAWLELQPIPSWHIRNAMNGSGKQS